MLRDDQRSAVDGMNLVNFHRRKPALGVYFVFFGRVAAPSM